MDFVNPALLGGIAAAALPVVLHLVMRQKPKHFEFPALRFLSRSLEANRRRLKLRHWLLLALRMALLALLALALARPSLQGAGGVAEQGAPVAATLIFDTSPRLEYRQDNRTRLEAAQEIAQSLAAQLPNGSRLAVLESSLSSAVFQVDVAAARHRIERLKTTLTGRPLLEVIDAGVELLSTSELQQRELYVFTDMTRAAWEGSATAALAEKLKRMPEVGIYLIDVGSPQPRNLSLDIPRLSAQVLPQTGALHVGTAVASLNVDGPRTVELWLGDRTGKLEKRSQTEVALQTGKTHPVEFPPLTLDVGAHQGEVRLVGEDGLRLDDRRYFTVQVAPPWKVLLAAAAPAERHTFLLEEAIAPADFRKQGQARFECNVVALEQLESLSLAPFAVVVLVDPSPLPPTTWKHLHDYAAGGGGLAVLLGRNARPLEAFNDPAAQQLLAGTLLQQARREPSEGYLAPANYTHPLLAKFAPLEDRLSWRAFPITRYWQLAELAPGAQVIVTYRDGAPALLERAIGRGRAITTTTPLGEPASADAWNRLLTELDCWPSLMLTNEMLLYLAGAADNRLNYLAGQSVVIRPSSTTDLSQYLLTLPDGEQQRRTTDQRQASIVVGVSEQAGNYRLRSGAEAAGFDSGFSVNLAAEATQLTRLADDVLPTLLGDREYHLARGPEEIDREVAEGRVGRELFPWLIALVALLLGGEQILSSRFYHGAT